MKIRAFAYMAAMVTAIFSLQACNSLEEVETGLGFVVKADLSSTKTINDGLNTKWTEGDAVHVFHKLSAASDWTDDGKFDITDTETGTFTGTLAASLNPSAKYDWRIVYPYVPGNSVSIGGPLQVQAANGSTAHICGRLCPLVGQVENLQGDQSPVAQMANLASVAKVTVVNSSNHPMTVNTVEFRDALLQVDDPGTIAVGDSADFYVVTVPFDVSSASPLEISVDSYKRTFKQEASFKRGAIQKVRFVYDNPAVNHENRYAWDSNRYSSFADIVHFGVKYYIAFREAGGHVAQTYADRGSIIILSSEDCVTWTQEAAITNDFDLRDPHFIVSDDRTKLYVYCGRTIPGMGDDGYFPSPYCSQVSILHLNETGTLELEETLDVDMGTDSRYWLWGVTRHKGVTYGVGYYIISNGSGYPIFVKSTDGVHFTKTANIHVEGNEAHPCFVDDRVYVFFRSVQTADAFVVYSDGPNYNRWKPSSGGITSPYTYTGMQMHCPATLYLWDKIFVCMRGNTHGIPIYAFDPKSSDALPPFKYVWDVFPNTSTDRAYPGMIVYDDCLHIAYYAYDGHAQNIFYQRIPLSKLYTLTENAYK